MRRVFGNGAIAAVWVILTALAFEGIIAWVWWPLSFAPCRTLGRAWPRRYGRGFAADGKTFFTFYHRHNYPWGFGLELWDVETGRLRAKLPGAYGWQAHSRDGSLMASAQRLPDLGCTAKVWDVRTGAVVLDLGPPGPFFAGEFTADGKKLVQVLDTSSAEPRNRVVGHRYDFFDEFIGGPAAEVRRAQVKVWDLADGQVCRLFDLPGTLRSWEFSGDGSLAAVDPKGGAIVWDALAGKQRFALPPRVIVAEWLARFSPDGTVLARGPELWDVQTGRELAHLADRERGSYCLLDLAFSADGKRCFVPSIERLHRFQVATGEEDAVFPSDFWNTLAGAWDENDDFYSLYQQPTRRGTVFAGSTPDGRFLATNVRVEERPPDAEGKWSPRPDVKVWDAQTGQELVHLKGEWQPCFSPDGKYLATLNGYQVKLWHVPPRKPVVPFLVASTLLIFGCVIVWFLGRRFAGAQAIRPALEDVSAAPAEPGGPATGNSAMSGTNFAAWKESPARPDL